MYRKTRDCSINAYNEAGMRTQQKQRAETPVGPLGIKQQQKKTTR